MLLLGADYYPEHRNPAKWEYDLDMMAGANLNSIRVGEFAWRRFEPRLGEFTFDWMDDFNAKAAERGIGLVMCPPLRTVPSWLLKMDPEMKIETQSGVRLEFGSRYTFCINHPLLLERGAGIAETMAEHYGQDDNIIGWHLDNEHGHDADCHCAICREKFQQWCRQRYGSIDALNEKWGLIFWNLECDDWDDIPTPRETHTSHGPAHLLAWRRFRSDSTVAAVGVQSDAVRPRIREGQFVSTNCQIWNPRTDYYKMAEHLDLCGCNYYPDFGQAGDFKAYALSMTRSYKQRNFIAWELKNGSRVFPGKLGDTPAPGEVQRLTTHCYANGADGTFYFRWRACQVGCEVAGSLVDYAGRPKRVYDEVRDTYGRLKKMADVLEGTSVRSDIAVLFDFQTRWTSETKFNVDQKLYVDQVQRLHDSLRRQRVNCDVVGIEQDFGVYELLVVPALGVIDDELAARLVAFVEGGGTLVWHPLSGMKDDDATIYDDRLHPAIKDLLGVSIDEFAIASPQGGITFEWQGRKYDARTFCDLPVLEGATSLGAFSDAWYAGTPAITERVVGKGRAMLVATFAEAVFYNDFFAALLEERGLPPILDAVIPDEIEVTERSDDDGRRLVFAINHSPDEQTLTLENTMDDLFNEERVEEDVAFPPYGARVLQLVQ